MREEGREEGREGRRKRITIYSSPPLPQHTTNNKVFQRQISKRELHSTLVEDAGHDIRNFSPDELRRPSNLIPPLFPPSPPLTQITGVSTTDLQA